jgi:hypothetical protein
MVYSECPGRVVNRHWAMLLLVYRTMIGSVPLGSGRRWLRVLRISPERLMVGRLPQTSGLGIPLYQLIGPTILVHVNQLTHLEQEPGAEVPSHHHPLCFAPLDFLLPLYYSSVKRKNHTFLDLVHHLRPCRWIIPSLSWQIYLDTSDISIDLLKSEDAHLSRLPVLKSDLSFPKTPISLPKTFLPDVTTAVGGFTSIISGATAPRRDERSESQSRINDLVEFLYVSESYSSATLRNE